MLNSFIRFLILLVKQIIKFIKYNLNYILLKSRAPSIYDKRKMELYKFRPFTLQKVDLDSNSTLPTPRSGHRIVCNDGNIYSFGGYNPDHGRPGSIGLFQELWKFNMHTEKWTLIVNSTSSMPKELASNAVILEGEILMVFGGTGFPFGENCSNKLSICYPNRAPFKMKRIKTRGDKPEPLYGQTMVYHDESLYVVGGTTGFVYYCDIHRLDLRTMRWECVYMSRDEVPRGRYRHGIAFDGSLIYILGGGTAIASYGLKEIPAFDLTKKSWKFIETLPDRTTTSLWPAARKCHSCVQYEGIDKEIYVVLAGGYRDIEHYDDIWRLNLKTYQWTLLRTTVLPKPLFFHDATASNDGCMYIFGGIMFNENNTKRVNDLYKIWMKIPTLTAICWEAVLHYYPHLRHLSNDKLLELGIPLKFVTALNS